MKKITSNIACFISGLIIASTVGAIAATYTATENAFPVKVNGQDVQMEGYNIEGSTYFKLRDIGDKMGFDVDFQDNIIYVGQTPKQTAMPVSTNNDIPYYDSPYSWCPDFGAYTGAELVKQIRRYSYLYTSTDDEIKRYFDLLTSLGFQKGLIDDDVEWISFVKNDCCISIDRDDDGLTGLIIGTGEWVKAGFTATD